MPLGAGAISFYRALFAFATCAVFLLATRSKALRLRHPAHLLPLLGLGLVLSGTWYFFVWAVQVSSVAVAVVCLYTYPLLTALLEPLLSGDRPRPRHVGSGLLVVLGCLLVVERFSLEDRSARGAALGLAAAICFSAYSIANRRAVKSYAPSTVSVYQFVAIGLLFAPAAVRAGLPTSPRDWLLLLLLGGVLTTASQLLFSVALKKTSASFASVLLSLQPLFASVFAALLLRELPTVRSLLGGALILMGIWLVLTERKPAALAASAVTKA